MSNVWVCSDPRWFHIKGHVPALKDPKSCQSYLPGGFCRAEDGRPCDAVEYDVVKRGKWIPISKDIARCSVCGQEIMAEDIPIMHYCNGKGCGALMSEEKG